MHRDDDRAFRRLEAHLVLIGCRSGGLREEREEQRDDAHARILTRFRCQSLRSSQRVMSLPRRRP